jgi:hypothetical protein
LNCTRRRCRRYRRSGWNHWGFDHNGHRGRRHGDGRTSCDNRPCRRLGDHWTGGRTGGNGGLSRGNDDGRRLARQRYNPARRRLGRGGHGWRECRPRWSGRRRGLGGRRGRGGMGQMALARLLFFLLLGGQNGLQHVAGLGDVREIDFGRDTLRRARKGAALAARPRSTLKLCADLLRLVVLQRTGVGLAAGQAKFRQNVKNPPTLDFHLACEIVNTNLTHPPLFTWVLPKALSRS